MFILSFVLVVIAGIVMVVQLKTRKSPKHVALSLKYDFLYCSRGLQWLMQDFFEKKGNKFELPTVTDKVVLITGGTRGIGLEVIRALMRCGFHVIMGCRNVETGKSLLHKYRVEGIKTGDVTVFQLDTSSMESVRSFARKVKAEYAKIDVLINNAAIMFGPYVESPEGFVSQFATNYLGHFLLTHLLLAQLREAGRPGSRSRIVNVTSSAHECGKIDLGDVNNRESYVDFAAYAQSKLAQILFSNRLDELMKSRGDMVESFAVHPGIVATEILDTALFKLMLPFWKLLLKTPEEGAVPVVYAAVSSALEGQGGTYVTNCRIRRPSELAACVELQKQLFEFTLKSLGIGEFGKCTST